MAGNKKSRNKKQKYITIRGVKVGVQNLCIMISTLLMTISILVFGIIYLSRDNGEAADTTTKGGNSIIASGNNNSSGSSGETGTDETITIESGTDAEETTEEIDTLEFDADDDDKSTSGTSPLTVKVTAASTWTGKNGNIIVQYKVTLENKTKKTIDNWGLSFHYNSNFTLLDRWNGVMEDTEDNVKITPTSINQTIKSGEKYEIGFVVETDGYVYPKSYTIVLDDFAKTVNLSFRRPVETTTPEATTEDETTEKKTNENETTTKEEETTTLNDETTEPSGEDITTTEEVETSSESDSETTTVGSSDSESETTTVSEE